MKITQNINKIKMYLPTSEELKKQSFGRILTAETYHYRDLKPVMGGLFCEQIFGPENSFKCLCGKVYFNISGKYKCKVCKVSFTRKYVRRERFAYIQLNTHVVLPFFYKSPYILSKIFNMNHKDFADVIHYYKYLCFKKDDIKDFKFIIDSEMTQDLKTNLIKDGYMIGSGGEILREYALCMDLDKEIEILLKKIKTNNKQDDIYKRYSILQSIKQNKTQLSSFFPNIIKVFPPNLRPMYIPVGETFLGSSDLNILYKEIINRNDTVNKYNLLDAPEILKHLSKASLQLSIDKLMDNRGNVSHLNTHKKFNLQTKKIYKSLIEYLITKNGILRKYILGKRSDFTARTVIVSDPKLKLGECSIPVSIAKDLLEPFIKHELLRTGLAKNLLEAEKIMETEDNLMIKILNKLLKSHLFLLNRAPTLHRFGIQAARVKLNNDKTIGLHPLNCKAFNADFDGDQEGIHSTLLSSDIVEAHMLMTVPTNMFSLLNGNCLWKPNKLMILGLYYATLLDKNRRSVSTNKIFSIDEIVWLYKRKDVHLHDIVKIVYQQKIITTTVGRILFNVKTIPEDLYDFNIFVSKTQLNSIIKNIFLKYKISGVLKFLDKTKEFGIWIMDSYGLTFSLFDLIIPKHKSKTISTTLNEHLNLVQEYYKKKISVSEYKQSLIDAWNKTIDQLNDDIIKENNEYSDHLLLINSGAHSNFLQLRQLCGSLGLVPISKEGNVFPIISSFKDGLSPLETFIATFGSRDTSISKNLRTAQTGFLNRRIILSLNEYKIKEYDCKSTKFLKYTLNQLNKTDIETHLFGRVLFEDILIDHNVILHKDDLLTKQNYDILCSLITKKQIKTIKVRSILTCQSKHTHSVCSMCFGADLSSWSLVSIGENVGVQSAQTLSEPTMQLTLSSFHAGSVGTFAKRALQHIITKNAGRVKFSPELITHTNKNNIFAHYINGHIMIDNKKYTVLPGDKILVENNTRVKKHTILLHRFQVIKQFAPFDGHISEIINATFHTTFDLTHHIQNIVCLPIDSKKNIYLIFSNNQGETRKISILPFSTLLVNIKQKIKKMDILCSKTFSHIQQKGIIDSFSQLENLFEVRNPQTCAFLAPFDGMVTKKKQKYILIDKTGKNRSVSYGLLSLKEDGEMVKKGETLRDGEIYPRDILRIWGLEASIVFLIKKIYKIYCNNGIYCNIKYIELVVKAMHSKVFIKHSNHSLFKEKWYYDREVIEEYNKHCQTEVEKITFTPVLLGLTKLSTTKTGIIASIAARETAKLLTESVVFGWEDKLESIESNLLFSIPVKSGTGFMFTQEQKELFAHNMITHINNLNIITKETMLACFTWDKMYLLWLDEFFGKHNKFLLSILLNSIFYSLIKNNKFSMNYKYKDEILCESIKAILNLKTPNELLNYL